MLLIYVVDIHCWYVLLIYVDICCWYILIYVVDIRCWYMLLIYFDICCWCVFSWAVHFLSLATQRLTCSSIMHCCCKNSCRYCAFLLDSRTEQVMYKLLQIKGYKCSCLLCCRCCASHDYLVQASQAACLRSGAACGSDDGDVSNII